METHKEERIEQNAKQQVIEIWVKYFYFVCGICSNSMWLTWLAEMSSCVTMPLTLSRGLAPLE